jgi:hypothetical protein
LLVGLDRRASRRDTTTRRARRSRPTLTFKFDGTIVAVLGVVKREVHEALERDSSAAGSDLAADGLDEQRVAVHAGTIAESCGKQQVLS